MSSYNDMFGDVFGDIFGNFSNMQSNKDNSKSSVEQDTERLNELWEEYDLLVQDLKRDGYKVLRNSQGIHKLVKNGDDQ